MIPTERSVIARLRYRSLDGGWIDVSLWRAIRIRAFPKNAIMDKQVLTTERKMSSPCTAPVSSTEHQSSVTVCRFSPPVKFFISMTFLRCGYSQLNSFLRAAVCKYLEFTVKTEISKYFIFSQKKTLWWNILENHNQSFQRIFIFEKTAKKWNAAPRHIVAGPKPLELDHFQSPREERRSKETSSSLACK